MPNLAMRQPGTQFSGDGLDLSWPIGGEREVISVPDDEMPLRVRRRIAEGQIVITDDKATKSHDSTAREYRLLTGEEARKHMAEPAGPVTRVVYSPATPEDERYYNPEVQTVERVSETFVKAQAERAKAAEQRHAEITKAQVAAEKAAAKDAKAHANDEDEDEDDPIALRIQRTEEASAEWHAERDKAFMEREKERQKEEAYTLQNFAAVNRKIKKGEQPVATTGDAVVTASPDSSEQDEAVMAAEKAREKEEAAVEKERAKEAAAAAKNAPPAQPVAGTTSPYVEPPTGGADAKPAKVEKKN